MDDLPALVDHFFNKACKALNRKRPAVPKELLTLLRNYSFPGNVRELEGMVFDAVVRHKSYIMSLESFREIIAPPLEEKNEAGAAAEGSRNPFETMQNLPSIKQAVAMLIEESLRRAEGNQDAAARLLGLSRSALSKRLNRSL
jgi:DNA-binding NtrC family response regulator